MSHNSRAVTSRHAKYTTSRDTHTQGGFNPAAGGDAAYGSFMDEGQIGAWQIPPGSINDGTIDPKGLPGDVITAGTLPASAYDNTPPAAPTDLALTTDVPVGAGDARFGVRIHAILTHPTDPDYFGAYVELTRDTLVSDPDQPDWSRATVQLLGPSAGAASFDGLLGNATYFARARAVDVQGNSSAYTAVVSIIAARDAVPPDVPTGLVAVGAFRGLGIFWDRAAASDLAYYDLRYRPLGTGTWTIQRVRATAIFVADLEPLTAYEVQVRAVDTSGNVVDSVGGAVDAVEHPELGWTESVTATPSQIGSADIAAFAVTAEHIAAHTLSADVIGSGLLRITTVSTEGADGLEVYLGATKVGQWDENGIVIFDVDNPTRYLRLSDGAVAFNDGSGEANALTPDGISADAIRLGRMPGGYNLIYNSGFELASFVTSLQAVWDVATDWSNTRWGAVTNLTEGTSLTMTAVSY